MIYLDAKKTELKDNQPYKKRVGIFLVPLFVYFFFIFLIKPWGEFPLNDDWQYAVMAQHFSESGSYHAILPTTASFVLQAWLGKLLINWFGFSHLLLRVSTIIITCLWLLIFQGILALAGIRGHLRTLLVLAILVNPLLLNLSLSFMTDMYGFAIAYAGAYLWLLHLKNREKFFSLALLASFIIGVGFWVRQLCVLVFPALFVSRLLNEYIENGFSAFRKTCIKYSLSVIFFIIPVISYFIWARQTGNLTSPFQSGLSSMLRPDIPNAILQVVVFTFYATAFVLPVLLLVPRVDLPRLLKNKKIQIGVFIFVVLTLGIALRSDNTYRMESSLHSHFPFLGNVLSPYGVGPINLTDVYPDNLPIRPTFYKSIWWLFEVFLLVTSLLWIVVTQRTWIFLKTSGASSLKKEILLFSYGVILFNFIVLTAAFESAIFDRYVLAILPGIILLLGSALSGEKIKSTKIYYSIPVWFFYFFYAVGGAHDWFSWNEVRWGIFNQAVQSGISPDDIDGGYEINGTSYFSKPGVIQSKRVVDMLWFRPERPYEISLNRRKGAQVLLEKPVHTWFHNFPPMFLVKKNQ